jgi:hypothetical protein
MEQVQIVSGFSELKDLLIQKFQIARSRERIRLYFTENDDQLLLHDFHEHKISLTIVRSIEQKILSGYLTENARLLCAKAIKEPDPVAYLNHGFLLYGYFRF